MRQSHGGPLRQVPVHCWACQPLAFRLPGTRFPQLSFGSPGCATQSLNVGWLLLWCFGLHFLDEAVEAREALAWGPVMSQQQRAPASASGGAEAQGQSLHPSPLASERLRGGQKQAETATLWPSLAKPRFHSSASQMEASDSHRGCLDLRSDSCLLPHNSLAQPSQPPLSFL